MGSPLLQSRASTSRQKSVIWTRPRHLLSFHRSVPVQEFLVAQSAVSCSCQLIVRLTSVQSESDKLSQAAEDILSSLTAFVGLVLLPFPSCRDALKKTLRSKAKSGVARTFDKLEEDPESHFKPRNQ